MKVETGKGGWGWEEDRSEQVVWASGAGGEVREKAEEEPGSWRGVQEVFIKLGSQLRLLCNLRRATSRPTFLFWCHSLISPNHPIVTRYHNDSMVNYEGGQGRIEVQRHTNGWGSTLLVI